MAGRGQESPGDLRGSRKSGGSVIGPAHIAALRATLGGA